MNYGKSNNTEKLFSSKVGIFEIESKSLGFHNIPFYANSPVEAINVVRASVRGGKDGYLVDNLNDLHLNCVGFYDTASGEIDTSKCPLFITTLDAIPGILPAKVGDDKK